MSPLYSTGKTNHCWEVRPSKSCSSGRAHQGEVPYGGLWDITNLFRLRTEEICTWTVSCIWLFPRVSGSGSWKVHTASPEGVSHPHQSTWSTHPGISALSRVVKSSWTWNAELLHHLLSPPWGEHFLFLSLLTNLWFYSCLSVFSSTLHLRQEEPRPPIASGWSHVH